MNRASRTCWESIWTAAKDGDWEAIPADVRLKSYKTIKQIKFDHATLQETLPQCRGIIITGAAGVGKTSYVKSIVPKEDYYHK